MELQEQLKLREFVAKNMEERYNDLDLSYKDCQDKLDKLQTVCIKAEKDILLLEEMLKSTDAMKVLAENRVNDLMSEKSFLVQEINDLKHQLKKIIIGTEGIKT
jgi:hypothetical protein